MKTKLLHTIICLILFSASFALISSCKRHHRNFNAADSLSVIKSVRSMTTNISRDLSAKGPVAWLDYFDNNPQFFMANDGKLSFRNYAAAKAFIQDTLVKNIRKINLNWSQMRIDALTPHIATIGSNFHEDIAFASGKSLPFDGYFSGTALFTPKGWKLRDAHWSIKKPAK